MTEYLDKDGLEYYTELVKDKMVFDSSEEAGSIPTHTAIHWEEATGTPRLLNEIVVDLIYPVGSIYISVNSTNPSVLFGGTWSAIPDGFYLRASSSDGGTLLNEKLPNVKSTTPISSYSYGTKTNGQYGIVEIRNANNSAGSMAGGSGANHADYHIDLSKGNSIYEDDAHVQPKSIKVFMWQRTA